MMHSILTGFMILTLLRYKALEDAYGCSVNVFYRSLTWPLLTVLFFCKYLWYFEYFS